MSMSLLHKRRLCVRMTTDLLSFFSTAFIIIRIGHFFAICHGTVIEGEELDVRRVCRTIYDIAFSIFDMILSGIK